MVAKETCFSHSVIDCLSMALAQTAYPLKANCTGSSQASCQMLRLGECRCLEASRINVGRRQAEDTEGGADGLLW